MKRGDLGDMVRTDHNHWLLGGDDFPWDENDSLVPTNIHFKRGEIGIILNRVRDPLDKNIYYLKLFTPSGIGWIFEKQVEVISEPR